MLPVFSFHTLGPTTPRAIELHRERKTRNFPNGSHSLRSQFNSRRSLQKPLVDAACVQTKMCGKNSWVMCLTTFSPSSSSCGGKKVPTNICPVSQRSRLGTRRSTVVVIRRRVKNSKHMTRLAGTFSSCGLFFSGKRDWGGSYPFARSLPGVACSILLLPLPWECQPASQWKAHWTCGTDEDALAGKW